MPDTGVINSPFDGYIPESGHDKGDESNVAMQGGDPGYKAQDMPSEGIPMATSRHANLDGGASVNNVDSQSPDAVHKRATGTHSTPKVN